MSTTSPALARPARGTSLPSVGVLAGGVGAARLLAGLRDVVPDESITAVVNTGDDTIVHGLHVSPDLDTVTYTLAGAIDPERGWGLAGETWTAMSALARYAEVRPEGSTAAPTWFNLGDRDLATHFYRTARLREGATLTAVTTEIATAWGVGVRVLPMSDSPVSTVVTTTDEGPLPFQDYFVRRRHDVAVTAIEFRHDGAAPTTDVVHTIEHAPQLVIAPSNPLVSIGPLRALAGVNRVLAARRESVIAISPIVAGAALKGPAARMLAELGHEPSVVGVARLYRDVAGTLVIDRSDADLLSAIEAEGMRCVVTDTVMSDRAAAARLGHVVLDAVS